MRAAGFQAALQCGVRAEALAQAVVRDRVAAVVAHGHAEAVARVAVDRARRRCRRTPARRPPPRGTGGARRAPTAARPARCAPAACARPPSRPRCPCRAGARCRRAAACASDGSRCSSALTSVPAGIAGAGMDHQPGRLVDDEDVARPRTGRRAGCPRAAPGSAISSATVERDRLAAAHRIARRAPARPSSRASPDLIHAARRERENSGNSSASTASKRRPAGLGDARRADGAASSRVSAASSGCGHRNRGSRDSAAGRASSTGCYYPRFVPSASVPAMTLRSRLPPPRRAAAAAR